MDKIEILPHFSGCAIHNNWLAYYHLGCQHGLCNAHHLRELIYVEEQYNQALAGSITICLLQAKEAVDEAKHLRVGIAEPRAHRLSSTPLQPYSTLGCKRTARTSSVPRTAQARTA